MDDIKNVKLKFSCPANWNDMTPTVKGHYCDKCNKTVHDFTNSKAEEFMAVMAENTSGFCGRFRLDQLAPTPVILPLWKRWLSAALVLVGINLFACKANNSQTLTGDTVILPPASQSLADTVQKANRDSNKTN